MVKTDDEPLFFFACWLLWWLVVRTPNSKFNTQDPIGGGDDFEFSVASAMDLSTLTPLTSVSCRCCGHSGCDLQLKGCGCVLHAVRSISAFQI